MRSVILGTDGPNAGGTAVLLVPFGAEGGCWRAAENATVMAWDCTGTARTTSQSTTAGRCGFLDGPGAPGGFPPPTGGRRAARRSLVLPG
jgi:hypothetical protein